MDEEKTYTEEELKAQADALLAAADEEEGKKAPKAAKKKSAKKKEKVPEGPVKTPEERLAELLEKGKKAGKLTAKELGLLEELNLDPEVVDKFYEAIDAAGIDRLVPIAMNR